MTGRGHRIYVDPRDPRAVGLVEAHGDLNPGSLQLWRRTLALHEWELVLDIGVNYGEMLVDVDLPPEAEVIGFEPNPAVREPLARTLAERGVAVEVRAEAVSRAVGTARFMVDTQWSGTSSLEDGRHSDGGRWTPLDVTTTTLDVVVGGSNRSFCAKVDVEGFEHHVVEGGQQVLEGVTHWALMLEVAHMPMAYLARSAEQHAVYLLDRRTGRLHRVPGGNAQLASELVAAPWLHTHDCLVASDAIASGIEDSA